MCPEGRVSSLNKSNPIQVLMDMASLIGLILIVLCKGCSKTPANVLVGRFILRIIS